MACRNGETHEVSIERAHGVDGLDYWLRVELPFLTVKHHDNHHDKHHDRNAGLDRERLVEVDDNGVFTQSGFDLSRRNGHLDE